MLDGSAFFQLCLHLISFLFSFLHLFVFPGCLFVFSPVFFFFFPFFQLFSNYTPIGNATWPLEGEAVNIEDTSAVSSFESTMRSQRWHPLTPKDQSCLGNNNLTSSVRMIKCGECWTEGSCHDQWGTVARWPWLRGIQGKQAGLDRDRAMIAVGRGSETNFMLKD